MGKKNPVMQKIENGKYGTEQTFDLFCTFVLYSDIIARKNKCQYQWLHSSTGSSRNIWDFLLEKFVMEKEGDTMIYFTSDLHLGHRGIIEMQNRPFENVQEMHQALIRN